MSLQGSALILGASNSTYINVTGGSDLLTGRPQNLCPPYENTLPNSSGVPVELLVVLQASVFPYGKEEADMER